MAASLSFGLVSAPVAQADGSLCATVKIEVQQQLTLERQAFDAHMRINNGLSQTSLESIGVVVTFADANGNAVTATSDPNSTNAMFFIRIDSMDNISDVSGAGSVAPSSSADIHWLIIPAYGAGGNGASGVRYQVGAQLTYRIGTQTNIMDLVPDSILVKPMPMLELDYFLPSDVYGDDPFTPVIEPPTPFSLGVRVRNTGAGVARSLSIESAQPKIVDNQQGLLIGFNILGSEVNGQAATASLLASFGDIQPSSSGVARWTMTTSLSGRFVDFSATYTHSDELGGRLTSLLSTNGIHTHFLVHDVLVDLPGRDNVRDFLAMDGSALKVYESENLDTSVTDQSSTASISGSGSQYAVNVSPSYGFSYIKLADPFAGAQTLRSASRSDGKTLNSANAWLSKTQDRNTHQWSYYVNLFDANNTGGLSYALVFGPAPGQTNRPPVLDSIPDHTVLAGSYLCFTITASDPDLNSLQFSFGGAVPSGAALDPTTGVFSWRPTEGQVGTNIFNVTVTDNGSPPLIASASFNVLVTGPGPVITNQPVDLTAMAGSTATFNVDASGEGLFYQWQFNSNNIVNATNAALVLTNLMVESAGQYAVAVTNVYGAVLSSNATLTVNLVPIPLGMIQNQPTIAAIQKLLAVNKAYSCYTLSLNSLDTISAKGGSISRVGGQLTYTPPPAYVGSDTFGYSVTNGHGVTSDGTVMVTIISADSRSANKVVSITSIGDGWVLLFAGIPGRMYVLQAASETTGPWSDLFGQVTASSTGLVQFTDYTTPPPSMRFYRIRAVTTP